MTLAAKMGSPSISLFTGAGGLDLGLEAAGFAVRVCVERDSERCLTLRLNRPQWKTIQDDIARVPTSRILKEAGLERGEVSLVSGGPPCQPFSKSAFWVPNRLDTLLKDPRANMLGEFLRIVTEARPRAFLMENVFGLAYSSGRPALDAMVDALEKEGYRVVWKVLDAADFGVPQKRERLFVVGSSDNKSFSFPDPTHGGLQEDDKDQLSPYVTAGDSIGDLDDDTVRASEKVAGKWGHLLPLVPPGDNYLHFTKERGHESPLFKWRSRYWSFLLKLSPDKPSWTIQANPGPYVGPFHWRNRRLRVSEIKRLQTFPDEYKLHGDDRSTWAQVGDAVPPRLGRILGQEIRSQLIGSEKTETLALVSP